MPRLRNQKGQGLVEYILIVVVMALMAIGGIRVLGEKAHNAFVEASDTLGKDMESAGSKGARKSRI